MADTDRLAKTFDKPNTLGNSATRTFTNLRTLSSQEGVVLKDKNSAAQNNFTIQTSSGLDAFLWRFCEPVRGQAVLPYLLACKVPS